jgi:TolB-like protein/Tfp pilus assembly protein PilF
MKSGNFFRELKRRNVYKVAIAYVVVAWLLIQAASILFPTFEAPAWVMKVFVSLLILGFPIALAFSWAFEITPEGIKREKEVAPNESITHQTGRKIVAITVVLAVLAAGMLIVQFMRRVGTDRHAVRSEDGGSGSGRTASLPVSEKSIAVLPFENLSDEKANAYFAEGIQDEILTRLSKIAALKVISRSSTQKYKSAPDNLREVGKQLGVANLLEGSVQKVANAVHVNVQLIRAATDEHLWAESYNRKLDDVFEVEGEVASAIAEQLNAKLTGAEQKAVVDKPTQNTAAYDKYLHGLSLENTQLDTAIGRQAAAEYARAVQIDPNFALAWARLAITRSYLYFNGIDPSVNSGTAVKEAADRAFALQPELGEAWIAQGIYRYRVLRRFPEALQSYEEALKRLPNSSLVFEQMAHLERRLGQTDAAEKHYQAAAQLDPRNLEIPLTLADLYQSLRRFKEAKTVLDHVLQISPGNEGAIAVKAFVLQGEGRLDESAKELNRIEKSQEETLILAKILQSFLERQFDTVIAQIGAAPSSLADDPRSILLLGYCQERAGHKNDARATFGRVIAIIQPSPASVVPIDARLLPCYLALAYADLGEKEKALEQARRAVVDYQNDILARPFAEQTLAQIQAYFGDLDAAIAALPHLLEVPNGTTRGDLRINPFWDPLRKDPRFAQFLTEPQPN